jgi:hypothetical protein
MNLSHHTRSPAALWNESVSKLILRSQRTSQESMKTSEVLNYQASVASEIVKWRAVIIYIRISVNVNIWHKPEYRSRCSDWTVWGSKPVIGKNASLLQKVQTGSGANLAFYSVRNGVHFRRPKRAVNHSLSNRTEVKKDWSFIFTQSICLRGIGRGNFTSSSM